MTQSDDPTTATQHQHHFEDLSPSDFERLVYWLVKESGDFDEVQRYTGARDKGRDVVAYKHTPAGREKWYIQCKRHQRIAFFTLHAELAKLAQHAMEKADFAPDVIVFATACDVPPNAKDKASDYACAAGLSEPYYWGRLELDEMLKRQPRIEREFFGSWWNRCSPRHLLDIAITSPSGWKIAITLLMPVMIASAVILRPVQLISQLPFIATSHSTPSTSMLMTAIAEMETTIGVLEEALLPTPRNSPTPAPTGVPMLTPTGVPMLTGSPMPTPIPTATSTPTPPTPTPTPYPRPVLSRPSLIEPLAGTTTREPVVFRWQGKLRSDHSFVVHLRHLASGFTMESTTLKSSCWETRLPARLFGEWRWQVSVVQGSIVLARSEELHFWLNPFPREPLPTPRPCTE